MDKQPRWAPGAQLLQVFSFTAIQLPGGSAAAGPAAGRCTMTQIGLAGRVHLSVELNVTSFAFVGNTLVMAGPITRTRGNYPLPHPPIGAMAFFAVKDNSPGAADEFAGAAFEPPHLTLNTAEEFVTQFWPLSETQLQLFTPLLAGGIWIGGGQEKAQTSRHSRNGPL